MTSVYADTEWIYGKTSANGGENILPNQQCTPGDVGQCQGTLPNQGDVNCCATCPKWWAIGQTDPSSGNVTCLYPAYDQCYLPDIISRSEWAPTSEQPDQIPITHVYGNNDRTVRCTYDLESFDTLDKVLGFQQKFPKATNQYDEIMVYFCALPSSQCSVDPISGMERTTCSNLHDRTEVGDYCRNWWASASDDNKKRVMTTYCENYNTAECECLNRNQNPIYKAAKLGNPFNDCCWWGPCDFQSSSKFFILPEDLKEPCKSCPKMNCEAIVANMGDGTINVKDIKQYINCKESNSGGGGGLPGPIPNPTPLWEQIAEFAVPIILLVIILIVLAIPQARNFVENNKALVGIVVLLLIVSGITLYMMNATS